MMRMGLIVVGLGILTAMELGTPSRTTGTAPDSFEQIKFDAGSSSDTFKKADRLEIHHLQLQVPAEPISAVAPTLPPDVTALAPEQPNTVGRGTNGKIDVVRKLNPKPQPKPKPKHTTAHKTEPKPTNSSKAAKADQSKATVEVKPCRPNAFDSLLQALNLSSRCQT